MAASFQERTHPIAADGPWTFPATAMVRPAWIVVRWFVALQNCPSFLSPHNFFAGLLPAVIAMGSPRGGDSGGGSISTFAYNGLTSTWDSYGQTIEGLAGEAVGYSIALSGAGSTIAVGYPRATNLVGDLNAGKTAVYAMRGAEWQPLGREIYGESLRDVDGTSVAMSRDGDVVAIGGRGRSVLDEATGDVRFESAGYCRIYVLSSTSGEWQFERSIEGGASEERMGSSASVSPDGSVVACGGAGGVRADGQTSGVVRVWNRVTLEESAIWPRPAEGEVEGALFGTSISMSGDGGYVIVGAPRLASTGAVQTFRDM